MNHPIVFKKPQGQVAVTHCAVQALNLDLAKIEVRLEAQRIMLANLHDVKRHAF
jgi:hypothetical protein